MGTGIREKIFEYITSLQSRNIAQNTILSYRRDLLRMADYLESMQLYETTDLRARGRQHLQDYIRQMEQERKRPATIARAAASIKSFFRYLEQDGSLAQNPAERLKVPRVEKDIPYILTQQEVVKLLRQPEGDSPKAVRDRAMLELLYATGIRVSELIEMETEDLNLAMEYLLCRQGMKERVVPFGKIAKKSLEEYLEKARPALVKDADCTKLFTNLSGRKMSRQGFWKLVKQYAKSAGIEGEITPHTLRHSFAAHLVHNGADLYAVQEMMGYADLSAAQVYAKMHHVSVREEYTKAHPREKNSD
ncbi:Tyrosine recombinase XerD [Eubacterium plexicaudatum ASF492]|uniref:Tyrosine recombinase XerC n=1 Tax=Eubacterium plexicaudatum ASF492 TaxID=1235802 RepID=N2A8S5_9FIRM|nr:Tyrosine recombinase XerD [Eubacterium plexicaudatum ASF492]